MTLAKVPLFLNRIVPFKYLAHLSFLLQKQTASVGATTDLPTKPQKIGKNTTKNNKKPRRVIFAGKKFHRIMA
jgi:hypothetical protein